MLKEINKNFLSSLSEIEKGKKALTETINQVIVEVTTSYPDRVKEQKTKIAALTTLKKAKAKSMAEIEKAKTKGNADAISKLNVKFKYLNKK